MRHKLYILLIIVISNNICFATDISEILSETHQSKSFLRKLVIERIYDQEILNNTAKYIGLVTNHDWSCSTVRIYIANVLIENADITTKQALDINTVLYRECVLYEVGAIPAILFQFLLCLPESADNDIVYKAISSAGWHKLGSMEPLSYEYFTAINKYIDRMRKTNKGIGRGSPAIDYEFPFRKILLTKKFMINDVKKGE
jgi:sporulation protein YlmC with PRC-barrel domain